MRIDLYASSLDERRSAHRASLAEDRGPPRDLPYRASPPQAFGNVEWGRYLMYILREALVVRLHNALEH